MELLCIFARNEMFTENNFIPTSVFAGPVYSPTNTVEFLVYITNKT